MLTPTCVIADGHFVVREGLRCYLGDLDWITLVGEAHTGDDALTIIGEKRPHLALVDVRMPGIGGVEMVSRLAREKVPTRVVIFSAFTDTSLVEQALDRGAFGYLTKDSSAEMFDYALQQVLAGRRFVDPALTSSLIAKTRLPLTSRQREVLELIAQGRTNAHIAEHLSVSQETVRTHVSSILGKLEASTRAQAVAIALKGAMIDNAEG